MQIGKHLLFWCVVTIALVVGFGNGYNDFIKAFYFVTFLLPVAIGTSYFFNYFLVPKYLLKGDNVRFTIYTIYTIVASLYLEMLVILLSFIIIANYNIDELPPIMANIFVLAITIYLIVMMKAFVIVYRKFKKQEFSKKRLLEEKEALEEKFITIKSNRINRQISLMEITFLESMGDYVNIHVDGESVTTKETITHFEDTLPDNFMRIHRSFMVNRNFVTAFSYKHVTVNGRELPVSRTYKDETVSKLSGNS